MLNIHPKVRKKGKDILVALAITLILLDRHLSGSDAVLDLH